MIEKPNTSEFYWTEFRNRREMLHFRQCRFEEACQICYQCRWMASVFNDDGQRVAWINQRGWWGYTRPLRRTDYS